MNKLILDFIDKNKNGYIIKYCDYYGTGGAIFLPIKIYKWYVSAYENDSTTFKINYLSKNINAKVSKIPTLNNNNMKIKFDNNILYIPDYEFNKITKSYCFQIVIEISVYDEFNHRLIYHHYKFLKNYDTRSKAIYYMEKFVSGFIKFYNKWFIHDDITYDGDNIPLGPYHGDIIYEHECMFDCMHDDGVYAKYKFFILSIEKG